MSDKQKEMEASAPFTDSNVYPADPPPPYTISASQMQQGGTFPFPQSGYGMPQNTYGVPQHQQGSYGPPAGAYGAPQGLLRTATGYGYAPQQQPPAYYMPPQQQQVPNYGYYQQQMYPGFGYPNQAQMQFAPGQSVVVKVLGRFDPGSFDPGLLEPRRVVAPLTVAFLPNPAPGLVPSASS
ncbi:unnamed protein product [Cyprideis torosa]|uniref:Uncharacterized protein n=1 Tax=Cyprideis torosa TaxID=163714 RepID=A0A7R8ZME9_9CRUS|nr:unnamed protein product [Cyprideis torosa]CAG0884190.1 unnamed protein product [Cyprideis torosa]